MEYKYFNPNPDAKTFKSGKAKSWCRNDSSIRAICCATGMTWDEVFKKLSDISLNLHDVPTSKNVVNEFCIVNGFEHVTYGKPKKGCLRPTVEEFTKDMNEGTYIAYLPHYFVCIKNGEVYNTEDVANSSIYSYWKMN